MTLYVEDTDDNSNEDREESIPELVENEELKKIELIQNKVSQNHQLDLQKQVL